MDTPAKIASASKRGSTKRQLGRVSDFFAGARSHFATGSEREATSGYRLKAALSSAFFGGGPAAALRFGHLTASFVAETFPLPGLGGRELGLGLTNLKPGGRSTPALSVA